MFKYLSPFKQLFYKNSKTNQNDDIVEYKNENVNIQPTEKIFKDEDVESLEEDVESLEEEDAESLEEEDAESLEEDDESLDEDVASLDKDGFRLPIEDASILIDEIPFFYLYTSTDMNKNMEIDNYLNEQNITKIKINIAIYKFNKTNYNPFLTFLLNYENNNKLLSFPYFNYTLSYSPKNDIDNCIEECKLKLLELFHILPDNNLKKINDFFTNTLEYKGYLHSSNVDELLIIFEYKDEKTIHPYWTTIHEIVNTKTRIKTPIPLIYKWFLEFPELIYILDIRETRIDIPYVLYSLDKVTTEETDKETYSIYKSKTKSLLPPYINHPQLGMKYYFTNNYVGEEAEDPNTRYVVFITRTYYILEDIANYKVESLSEYDSIYFQQQGEPIWAISNLDYFTTI